MLLVSLPADSDDRLLGTKIDNIRDIGEIILQNRQILRTVSAATAATLPLGCTHIRIRSQFCRYPATGVYLYRHLGSPRDPPL